jgi:hypothetical protein
LKGQLTRLTDERNVIAQKMIDVLEGAVGEWARWGAAAPRDLF